jgi:hypothetical protein
MPQMTPVRPELMRFDSSAISRGGQAFGQGVGQGLAQLGAGIGQAIQRHRKKVSEDDMIASGIDALVGMGYTADEAKSAVKSIGAQNVGRFVSGLHEINARFRIQNEQKQMEGIALARALQGSYLAQSQEQIEAGEQPQVDWQAFQESALESGVSPGSISSFVKTAEATGLKESSAKDLVTKDIDGTDYVAIIQPSGSVSVVPKEGKPNSKEAPTPDDVYKERADAAKRALDNGVLTEEQYEASLEEAKREVYGLPKKQGITLADILMHQLSSGSATNDDGWRIE